MFSDAKSIIFSVVFSLIGTLFVGLGKKRLNYTSVTIGVLLMFFPYFVTSWVWMIIIGCSLTLVGWIMRW